MPSCATYRSGCALILPISFSRPAASIDAGYSSWWPKLGDAGLITSSSRCSSTYRQGSSWPHHQVATEGMRRSSPRSWRQRPGRKRQVARRFNQPAAQSVVNHHGAVADGLHQAGHTQQGISAQFEGIAEAVVKAAHDQIHRLQAGQGFQIDAAVAHRQVIALPPGGSPNSPPERSAQNRCRCAAPASAPPRGDSCFAWPPGREARRGERQRSAPVGERGIG